MKPAWKIDSSIYTAGFTAARIGLSPREEFISRRPRVVLGYYQYHAIPGHPDRLNVFRHRLRQLWAHVIRRRSQRSRLTGQRLNPLLDCWTPPPRVLHPCPMERFAAPKYFPQPMCGGVAIFDFDNDGRV
jgi:hypothetical protein